MRIILSAAVSADGYLDDFGGERLILSSPEDWRAVYALRAECDAILVGAQTLRQDNPSLVIRDPRLRKKRVERGQSEDIMKVTVSGSGKLNPRLRFFTEGAGEKVVFTTGMVTDKLSNVATIVSRPRLTPEVILSALEGMGVGTLMIEGGSRILSMFLVEGAWDELRLAVAPIFVGDTRAARLVQDGEYPPMNLVKTERLGQTAVMHFVNRSQFRVDYVHLARAIRNGELAAPVSDRYRVGAVILTLDGQTFDGHTGETDPANHAEEEALMKADAAGADLHGATMYSTIEPCSMRKSKKESCARLIIDRGIGRVVFAMSEPDHFVRCESERLMTDAGLEVVQIPSFTGATASVNDHILKK